MGSGYTEIGLVLFTTLAPAGAVAFILVALVALFGMRGVTAGRDGHAERLAFLRRVSHYLIIPLGVAVIGLIASATQLGTPANALNVFRGVGRSPLSDEVIRSVLFLALAGLYWLASFYDRVPDAMSRVWLGLTCVAALIMVGGISRAYAVSSIPTWDSVYVPINLWLVGVYGGPLLAMVTLVCADADRYPRYRVVLYVISAIGLVGETICCALQNASLSGYANGVVSGTELVPGYPWMIAGFAVLGLLALIGVIWSRGRRGILGHLTRLASMSLVMCAIFLVRFAFYGLHMTIGM